MQKLRIALGFSLAFIAVWIGAFTYISLFPENQIPDYTKDDGKVSIVATIYPLAWMASDLDPAATVTTIVGPGLEPHDFSPTIDDVKKIQDAELLINNGGVDAWADDIINDHRGGPTISVLTMLQYPETDLHVWLDPVLMQRIVESIGGQLELIDPKNADVIRDNVSKKIAVLQRIDDDYRAGLASCSIPEIVSSHDAFGFLAKRYGFTVHSIAGISPEDEPSTSKLVELTDLIRSRSITTVFFEELASPALAKTLADETGAKSDVLDVIESLASEESERLEYPGIMEKNLVKLKAAMVCQE
ncbi:MAG: metal ABC transporter substrate-binding protein [Patescibacteria group bacterium]